MLARPLMALVVLTSAGTGSLLLAGGTSSATSTTRVTYGPVARPVVVPLVDVHGPLLPLVPSARAPLGPVAVVPAAPVGPPGLVGPGSTPREIRVVQRLLNRHGARLSVDGAWGPATTRAVERVQERAGLPVDGRVGPSTAEVLTR